VFVSSPLSERDNVAVPYFFPLPERKDLSTGNTSRHNTSLHNLHLLPPPLSQSGRSFSDLWSWKLLLYTQVVRVTSGPGYPLAVGLTTVSGTPRLDEVSLSSKRELSSNQPSSNLKSALKTLGSDTCHPSRTFSPPRCLLLLTESYRSAHLAPAKFFRLFRFFQQAASFHNLPFNPPKFPPFRS